MTGPAEPAGGLLRSRTWRLFWLATSVSVVGDSFFDVTVMLWVAEEVARGRSWAPAAAGGVLIAAAVPYLTAGPVAGVFVDRWDRRRVMLTADACRCALIASLVLLPAAGGAVPAAAKLMIIYVVVAGESCFAQFFNPCRFALLALIVPGPQRARASGQIQATSGLAAVIGPPLAGALLFTAGPPWALIIDAVSFALSFTAIRAICLPSRDAPGPAVPPPGFMASLREGLEFFAGNRVVLAVCITVAAATLGTGALNAIEVFFVTGDLHQPASRLGFLLAGSGAGSIAGNLLGGPLAARLGTARTFSASITAAGILLVIFSLTQIFPAALAAMAAFGIAIGTANAACPPLLLAATPQNLIGRMTAVFNPVQQLAGTVSMAAAGFLASTLLRGAHLTVAGITLGPAGIIIAASGILILAAGLWSIRPVQAARASQAEPGR